MTATITRPSQKETISRLLDKFGTTFAEELGINIRKPGSDDLFRLLSATLLFSIRIGWKTALNAARSLSDHGWTTAEKMGAASWEQRVKALDEARYVRYDESMSARLGEMAECVMKVYKGDLASLREKARRDPAEERKLLQEFKGIGDTGADIFFREIQGAWDEVYPFMDERSCLAARKLGLKGDPADLAAAVGKNDFARFVAALVRVDLENAYDRICGDN